MVDNQKPTSQKLSFVTPSRICLRVVFWSVYCVSWSFYSLWCQIFIIARPDIIVSKALFTSGRLDLAHEGGSRNQPVVNQSFRRERLATQHRRSTTSNKLSCSIVFWKARSWFLHSSCAESRVASNPIVNRPWLAGLGTQLPVSIVSSHLRYDFVEYQRDRCRIANEHARSALLGFVDSAEAERAPGRGWPTDRVQSIN
jgi:hypothetical protein